MPDIRRLGSEFEGCFFSRRQFVAGFQIDPAYHLSQKEAADCRDFLLAQQEYVKYLLQVSTELPETFPLAPNRETLHLLGAEDDRHLDLFSARVMNTVRLLQLDAGRAWDDDDPSGYVQRIIAGFRFAHILAQTNHELVSVQGRLMLTTNLFELEAYLRAGLLSRIENSKIDELLEVTPRRESVYLRRSNNFPNLEPIRLREALAYVNKALEAGKKDDNPGD